MDAPALPGESPVDELIAAAPAITHITQTGGHFLVTFDDGREVELRPGDAHILGPLTKETTFSPGPGEEPDNLHALFHSGALPASLHAAIMAPPEPSAADMGLHPGAPPPPDAGPPGMDAEDMADGGADEAQEGEAPLPPPPDDPRKRPTLPGL